MITVKNDLNGGKSLNHLRVEVIPENAHQGKTKMYLGKDKVK